MFDIYGCHFFYGAFDSSMYDLIVANYDTERIKTLQQTQVVNTVRSRRNNMHYVSSIRYEDEPMSFDMEILTYTGNPIDESCLSEVEHALFFRHSYTKLCPLEGYDIEPFYINCLLTNPERIETEAGTVGYKCTVVMDSSMAWEEPVTITKSVSGNGTRTFMIDVDSDMDDYIYPTVVFTMSATGGNFTIYNNTDDATRLTTFEGLSANASFTMNSSLNYISGNHYDEFKARNFVRLVNGTNYFVVTGNLKTISITFNNRKYL